jgi:hypothetical protein
MVLTIIFALVLLVAAALFFVWVMNSMLDSACPKCQEDGREELVVPIIPGFRWFCPTCSSTFVSSEVRGLRSDSSEEDPEE